MSTQYELLPTLGGVYLEDSYVLAIEESSHSLTFRLEAVLTPDHPRYRPPRAGEQYCYASGTLTFASVDRIEWISRTSARYQDANNEEDQGNIDYLDSEAGKFHLGGDWGEVRIWSAHPPVFELADATE